jgi:hypothetical protein
MSVMSFEVVDGRVATIRSIVNPDKLDHLGSVESLRDVLDAARPEALPASKASGDRGH